MPDTIIRPSIKLVKLTYWMAILLAAVVLAYSYVDTAPRWIIWLLLPPAWAGFG